jgi:acyl-CoA hydrolase
MPQSESREMPSCRCGILNGSAYLSTASPWMPGICGIFGFCTIRVNPNQKILYPIFIGEKMGNHRWPDEYLQKRTSPQEAIRRIHSGQRVFIGTASGEPPCLVNELAAQAHRFADLEIIGLFHQELSPLTLIAHKSESDCFSIRSFYLGSIKTRTLAKNKRFITPINLSGLPRLFKTRQLPIHTALIQVSPPDDFGWMSLGISVDVTLAAAQAADLVIAQVNPQMPRVLGQTFLHVNEVDLIVEHEEPLLTIAQPPVDQAAFQIGQQVAKLIEDGSTLHMSLGASPQAILMALQDKRDLGIHTRFLTDAIMNLVVRGIITNRKKGFNEGKLVASGAIGSRDLYDFIEDNPGIEFYPSDYVNNPGIIARHHKMASINVAMSMDLTGQVAADALPYNHFAGTTSMVDFIRGASESEGGKAILILPSTTPDGKKSRILPVLDHTAVVVPRGDVHYVATEFGVVNLFGKSLQERALALISIAHPGFREGLFKQAKDLDLLGPERTLSGSLLGICPPTMETIREIGGQSVVFRPARPADERLMQEHFYSMDKADIFSRFLHEKLFFSRKDVAVMVQVDYIREMPLVAVVGEFGFEKVIAVGAYFLNPVQNLAEVAFSVIKGWQKKGLCSILLLMLAEIARDKGIAGLVAYTQPQNQGMIKLFHKLPYKITTGFEEDMLTLTCHFEEPLD